MSDKEDKPRVGPMTFIRQVRAEGNKVTWTSRQETLAATAMVIVMSVIVATFLFLVDQVIAAAVRLITGLGN
ncbi:MAG: preprotein translocase subunit SecE [Pseudomonadota bacterium]